MLHRIRLLMLAFCLLFLFSTAASADADYEILNYAMYIEVQRDGSAEIFEALGYEFDGEYNGILSLFDADGIGGIENFRVSIDGVEMTLVDEMTYIDDTYTITETGDNLFEIRVYSPGRSDRRVVTYEYTMLDLAKRYADTGMIHRKLIGGNNAVTLQQAGIVVNFPEHYQEIEQVEAFVHGGMDTSHVSFENGVLSIGPENVRPGSAVEVRLLFPASWLADASIINEKMYDAAIAEEAQIAKEEAERAIRTENAKYIFAAAYTLIFFVLWLITAKKYGLKGRLHETPDSQRITRYPAAFLTAALEDEADTDALSGTLMELVADGKISMEHSDDEGIRFTLLDADTAGLYPHQAALIEWLFADQNSFLLADLNAGSDYERAQHFETGYNRYTASVSSDMLAAKLRYKNDGIRIGLNALIIILGAMGVGGILLAGKPNILLGIIVGAMLFLLVSLMSRIRRLTDEGERLQADASAFKEAGISSEAGYVEFVAYYAALGMTEPLVEAMKTDHSDSIQDDTPAWMYAGWYYSLHTLNSSMRDTHHHNASIPNPNASSSGSHGGGSNGGGGGHGAW